MSKRNNINITVDLDVNKVPAKIQWNSTDLDKSRTAKAMLLSLWDGEDMNTMNIDLWTKEMSVEEMSKFFFQTYITMIETFEKATGEDQMALAMRDFAEFFGEKMKVIQPSGKFDK